LLPGQVATVLQLPMLSAKHPRVEKMNRIVAI
jgi:hypothetical protein